MRTMDAASIEHHLIGDIYDAALNPTLWSGVLGRIATLVHANSAIITAFHTLNPDYALAFTHNIPEETMRVYSEHGLDAMDMEINGAPLKNSGVGSMMFSSTAYGSQEEYVRRCGELYSHCFAPSNIHYLCGTLLDHGDFRWAAMGFHRPARATAFTPEEALPVQRLGPHIRRALHIHRQLSSVQSLNARLYRTLDGLTTGVILLNRHGLIRYANTQAEHLLRHHGGLRVTVREGLQAALPAQDNELRLLIQNAVATGRRDTSLDTSGGGVIGLQAAAGDRPLMLTITPLSELAGYGELMHDDVAAAIFMSDPTARHTPSRKLLKSSYGLTDRECDICEAFVNHVSLEKTAEACELSLSSLRSYMKTIYEKTRHHSQAELMRLLMGLTMDFEHIR